MPAILPVVYSCIALYVIVYLSRRLLDPMNRIPTVGGNSYPLLSYLGAVNFIRRGKDVIETGYYQYFGSAFKVAMLDQWMVVVSGPELVNDLISRPESELSAREGAGEFTSTAHSLGAATFHDPFHIEIIRNQLTKSIPEYLPDMVEETAAAMAEYIPPSDDWVTVKPVRIMQAVVTRVTNRVYVGLPLCRNGEYIRLVMKFTSDVVRDRTTGFFNFVPDRLKRLVRHKLSYAARTVLETMPLLEYAIKSREAAIEENGSASGNLSDMLGWITKETLDRNGTVEDIVARLLLVNFATNHSTSHVGISEAINHALLHLAESPHHVRMLRQEAEQVLQDEGWTKTTLGKLHLLDSYLRESQRLNGVNTITMMRKARSDVTLSNGTVIPKGTLLVAPQYAVHHDERNYPEPYAFRSTRFMRAEEDHNARGLQYVTTTTDFIPFGHGKHACPGRFFAVTDLKVLVLHIVLNYDLKLVGNGPRPHNVFWGTNVDPPFDVELMFRRRRLS